MAIVTFEAVATAAEALQAAGQRASVRASLRLMVKRILRKYKYPPDQQDAAVELVLQQAQALGESWA